MKTHKTQFLAALAVLITAAVTAQAQFTYITNNDAITITGYNGTNSVITIPSSLNELRVTKIGTNAFAGDIALISITIPDTITDLGDYAFYNCHNLSCVVLGNSVCRIGNYAFSGVISNVWNGLPGQVSSPILLVDWACSITNINIPNSVKSIGDFAFYSCRQLSSVTFGSGVSTIGAYAFSGGLPNLKAGPLGCPLISITIPESVTNIADGAFADCYGLTRIYFLGDAPLVSSGAFYFDNPAPTQTAYVLPGTTGWAEFTTDTGVPTALWTLPQPLILNRSYGVQPNGFGFTISWATNVPVVIEASADLSNPVWTPVATNTLSSGTSPFSDPDWTNYPSRFYRLRSQ